MAHLQQGLSIIFLFILVDNSLSQTLASATDTETQLDQNGTDSVTYSPTDDYGMGFTTVPEEGTENVQQECELQCRLARSTPNWFSIPEKGPLGLVAKACALSPPENSSSCTANLSTFFKEPLQDRNVSDLHYVFYNHIQCASPVNIRIQDDSTDLSGLKDVIGYLQLSNCDIYWSDIAKYGNIVDLRVLYLNNRVDNFTKEIMDPSSVFYMNETDMQGSNETIKDLPAGLQNIGTLALWSSGRGQQSSWSEIFLRYNWSLLAEINLTNMTFQEIPEGLMMSMPILQTLEVDWESNLKTLPSFFPWDNQTRRLPRNLCRTRNANQHYTRTFHIPGYRYRRIINWQNGNLQDLSNFTLSGSLDKIEIKYSNVTRIGPDLFKNVRDVQHIDLSHNEISVLPDGTFHGLDNLIQLNLDSNMLDTLPRDTFRNLPRLKTLHLENNMLTRIESEMFYHLTALQKLDISHNKIQYLAENAISTESDTITEIQASHNHLKYLPTWVVLLRNAKTINFSYNQIKFVHFYQLITDVDSSHLIYQHREDATSNVAEWRNMPSSGQKELDLSHNNFTTIRFQDFNETQLEVFEALIYYLNVNLDGNSLHCDCNVFPLFEFLNKEKDKVYFNKFYLQNWRCASPAQLADRAVSLVQKEDYRCPVTLEHCPKSCMCYNRTVDGLIQVDCSNANLTKLPENLPDNAKHLILRHNSLEVLTEAPSYLPYLQVLDLSYNAITSISAPFARAIGSIETVQLDHNKLAYYPKQFQSQELGSESLTIGSNPIKCDCHSAWVKDWVLQHRHVIRDIDDIRCVTGKGDIEILVEVPLKEFVCEAILSETYRNVVITLCVLVVLVVLVVSLLYRFRGEIKVLLYVHFHWHPFDKNYDEDTDKEYDAFVSYSAKDYQWVCHVLRRRLEAGEFGDYKLCLHDRDFMVGAPIHDNIMNAVNKSRRMILVLSRNFIKSDWCMLEFRTAHLKAMKDKVKYLIIIFYDEIHENELDEDLKLYIHTNTYLSIHNKWFWEKLSYAMPKTPIMALRPDLPKLQQLTYPVLQADNMSLPSSNPDNSVEIDLELQQARMSKDCDC